MFLGLGEYDHYKVGLFVVSKSLLFTKEAFFMSQNRRERKVMRLESKKIVSLLWCLWIASLVGCGQEANYNQENSVTVSKTLEKQQEVQETENATKGIIFEESPSTKINESEDNVLPQVNSSNEASTSVEASSEESKAAEGNKEVIDGIEPYIAKQPKWDVGKSTGSSEDNPIVSDTNHTVQGKKPISDVNNAVQGKKSESNKNASSKKVENSSNNKQTQQTTSKPVSTQDPKKQHTVTLSISCNTILNNKKAFDQDKLELLPEEGMILSAEQVEFKEGETVFDVLVKTTKAHKIHMEYTGAKAYNTNYIEGIHNIYEFDCGPLSGWMYKVNGVFPNYGCSSYVLKEGDIVEWVYTCDLGKDVGAGEVVQEGEG